MDKSILVIDDDPVTHTIAKGVTDPNAKIISCYTVTEALKYLENHTPSLTIIDRMLPDGDGLSICSFIRSNPRLTEVPIVFLSSCDTELDKAGGLFAGADDYITKPVTPLELKARIFARLRTQSSKVTLSDLSIDLSTQRVILNTHTGEQEINLTRIEFKLLAHFAQNIDRVFAREFLLNHIWGHDTHLNDRAIDTHISHLRKKISKSGVVIEALRGEGYKIFINKNNNKSHAA